MNTKKAIKLAIECIQEAKKKLAVDYHLATDFKANSPLILKRAERYKMLDDAEKVLSEMEK